MYQGANPSALRSRKWITEALLALLGDRKYCDITVKVVCSRADLSRQTFYQIFDSKDEVMEYHFARLFAGFQARCGSFEPISCQELACQFFRFFYDERAFVTILIENNMTYLLERAFELYLPQIGLFRRINETEEHPDYSVAYVAGALTQLLVHWFARDFDVRIEEAGALAEHLISGRIYAAAMNVEEIGGES